MGVDNQRATFSWDFTFLPRAGGARLLINTLISPYQASSKYLLNKTRQNISRFKIEL